MTKRLSLFIAFVAIAAISAAQMPGMRTGRGMLIMQPDVSKELKITKEQNKQFQQALETMQKEMQAGNLSGFNIMDPFSAIDSRIEGILDEKQKVRLEELFIQKNLGFALADKRVAEKTTLTAAQIEQIATIDNDTKTEVMNLTMKVRSNGDLKKLKEFQLTVSTRMLAVMDADQTLRFETAKGKPFKFKT